ncbi:MAG: hypothetical protein JWO95_2949 [Verrucomicrobiales bacterium]|nr:hypothetical protein [Verrucomicrobiales bacterium]
MKPKRQSTERKYPPHKSEALIIQDALPVRPEITVEGSPMIRTQIYLSRTEHEFVQTEASRLGKPMAAVIRDFIDEKMELPDDVWTNNPMLKPIPHDSTFAGHEDGAINHDHYIYGTPKRYMKRGGEWVETPPLPDDYYQNAASRAAYDEMVNKEE